MMPADIEFGFRIAKESSRLDIGQIVVVRKDRDAGLGRELGYRQTQRQVHRDRDGVLRDQQVQLEVDRYPVWCPKRCNGRQGVDFPAWPGFAGGAVQHVGIASKRTGA